MAIASRVDGRRVFALGIAGLAPAALVTLLLVNQPSVGERRLYPMMRGSLALVGLALALITLITWAMAPDRLSRSSLSGLAWASVTAILCIGPFLESTPRPRLYALNLETGKVEWGTPRAGVNPHLFEGVLAVTDSAAGDLVGVDLEDGDEVWRAPLDGIETSDLVDRAVAAGVVVLDGVDESSVPTTSAPVDPARVQIVDGQLAAGTDRANDKWPLFEGEVVLAVATEGDDAYAYVAVPGERGYKSAAVVKISIEDGQWQWREPLDPKMVVVTREAALDASAAGVVVAGGEVVGLLKADNGALRWSWNVVTLGKSRGYALSDAIHQIEVTDDYAYLSTMPDT